MDKETVRKQIADEIEGQFDSQLKQAKRQKEQAEEELESSTARWRAERRRLNTEIDRLEAALAEAKEAAQKRRKTEPKTQSLDTGALTRVREEADEKFNKASAEWNGERARLKAEIVRLEVAIAEALERSSNPLRATQSVREQLESQLHQVGQEKTDIEQTYLRAKTQWQQEKLKMTGEMVKLRRTAQIMGKPVPSSGAPEVNPRVRDLEIQLQESLSNWESERARLSSQVQSLEASSRHSETERRRLSDHANRLQQTLSQAEAKIQTYEAASGKATSSESKLAEIDQQKQTLKRDFESARKAWDSEKRDLNQEIDNLQQTLSQTEAKIQAYEAASGKATSSESKLAEIDQQKQTLKRDFESARKAWDSEKRDLNQQIENLQKQLQTASEAQANPRDGASDRLKNEYEQKLQQGDRERTLLAQELQTTRHELEGQRMRFRGELERQVEAAAKKWEGERESFTQKIQRLEQQLDEIPDLQGQPGGDLLKQLRKQYEQKLHDAMHQKMQLERELQSTSALLEVERTRVKTEVERRLASAKEAWEMERRDLLKQIEELQRQFQTTSNDQDHVSGEILDQLRKQYEQKLQETINQKTQLTQELQTATALLEKERSRLSGQIEKSKNSGFDDEMIAAEMARVEALIREIAAIIDDPHTELATVIRKNAERSELGAYLKGILFSTGRAEST